MGKIKEIPIFPEYEEEYTCKRCGCNLSRHVRVTNCKFGGEGLGNVKLDVCANCLNGTNLRD